MDFGIVIDTQQPSNSQCGAVIKKMNAILEYIKWTILSKTTEVADQGPHSEGQSGAGTGGVCDWGVEAPYFPHIQI